MVIFKRIDVLANHILIFYKKDNKSTKVHVDPGKFIKTPVTTL